MPLPFPIAIACHIAMADQWRPFALTHVTYPTSSSLPSPLPSLLALLSLAPPFGVCSLVTGAIVYKDVAALYLLVGSVGSTCVASVAKRIVRHPRPPRYDDVIGEGKESYGMPSNHATFVWFVAAFAALWAMRGGLPTTGAAADGSPLPPPSKSLARAWRKLHASLAVGVPLLVAVGCSYSRVYLGYHTAAQVYAGSVLGSALGAAWYGWMRTERVGGFLTSLDATVRALERARMGRERTGGRPSNGSSGRASTKGD